MSEESLGIGTCDNPLCSKLQQLAEKCEYEDCPNQEAMGEHAHCVGCDEPLVIGGAWVFGESVEENLR